MLELHHRTADIKHTVKIFVLFCFFFYSFTNCLKLLAHTEVVEMQSFSSSPPNMPPHGSNRSIKKGLDITRVLCIQKHSKG